MAESGRQRRSAQAWGELIKQQISPACGKETTVAVVALHPELDRHAVKRWTDMPRNPWPAWREILDRHRVNYARTGQ